MNTRPVMRNLLLKDGMPRWEVYIGGLLLGLVANAMYDWLKSNSARLEAPVLEEGVSTSAKAMEAATRREEAVVHTPISVLDATSAAQDEMNAAALSVSSDPRIPPLNGVIGE